MNQVAKLEKLHSLSYFDVTALRTLLKVSEKSLHENINRWVGQKKIITLKRGLYVTSRFIDRVRDPTAYKEFIANRLRLPSYLSLEYVLEYHNILTESVFGYTSVCLKTKRRYYNDFGTFSYKSINEELFTGFETITKGQYEIKMATKTKALFDYLYLKLYRVKEFNTPLIDSLRLNLDDMTKKDIKEFAQYCALTKISKFIHLPTRLFPK